MPRIAFWCGTPGGTAWYRCLAPGRALRRLGWEVEFFGEQLLVSPVDGHIKGRPDFLVLCRMMGEAVVDIIRKAQNTGTTVIYDTDDWFRGLPGYNPASRIPQADIDSMHAAMEQADLLTVSTPGLAEGYADLNRTIVLPNYLDPVVWNRERFLIPPHKGIRLGVLWAFRWRQKDAELLKPWLPRFLRDHPEVSFCALGCPELLKYLDIPGHTTTPSERAGPDAPDPHVRPYHELPAVLVNLDIGLVPLAFNRFNWMAKSACKALEYGACGIPAIASPSDENRTYIRPGVNGYLVRGQEWAHAVERAIANLSELRAGARRVAESYFIDEHIHRWVEAYESVSTEEVPHLRGAMADVQARVS